MPISGSDLLLLRNAKHMSRFYWNFWPEEVIATATIDEDSVVKYPTPKVKVTDTVGWDDIRVGMRFVITNASGQTVTTGVVRKEPNATNLFIDAKSSGDTGWAEVESFDIETGQTVTVYNDYPIWTVFSRIKNGVYYKKWDEAYTDQGSSPDPVCNMGTWRQELVDDDADLALVTFSASTSFAWGDKTISSYSWTLPAGATVITGSISTATLSATFPVGFHLIYCTVTDSDGKTADGIRPLWVNTRTGANAPKSKQVRWRPDSDGQDLKGRTKSITFTSDGSMDDVYYRGMGFLFTEESFFGGAEITTANVLHTKFVGFQANETRMGRDELSELTLEMQSPYVLFGSLPQVSQVIIERATPNSWIKVSQGLADPSFIFWYIVYYHVPNALKLFDFIKLPEVSPPRKRRYGIAGTTIQQQTDEAASYIGGSVGSASDGTFLMFRDPTIENDDFRDALDNRLTILGGDVVGEVSFNQMPRMKTGQLVAYGFILDQTTNKLTAVGSIAPGKQQPQATGKTQAESLLVLSQTDLNERSGHMLAKENDPVGEFTVTFDRNFDIFDPARHANTWFTFDLPDQLDPRGNPIEFRALCVGVSRNYKPVGNNDGAYYIKEISATFRRETKGRPGDTLDLQTGAGNDTGGLIDPEIIIDSRLYPAPSFAWNETSLGRTYNFMSDEPAWTDISGDIAGKIADFCIAPYSPYITSGYLEGSLYGYVISTDSGNVSIWGCDTLFDNSPEWVLVASYIANDATPEISPQIIASKDVEGMLAASWRDNLGTYVVWSSDFGVTWSAVPVQVGDRTSGEEETRFEDYPYGFALDGTTTITTDRLSGEINYKVFYTTTIGGAFTAAPNTEEAGAPIQSIKVFEPDTNLLVSMNNPTFITVDVAGWEVVYDFTESDHDFTLGGLGEYVPGSGYRTTLGLTAGVSYHNSLHLDKTWSSGVFPNCKGVAFVYSYDYGNNSNVSFIHTKMGEDESAGVNIIVKYEYEVAEGFPSRVTYPLNNTLFGGFSLSFVAGEHQSLSPIDPDGELTLRKMYMWGNGTNPDPDAEPEEGDGIGFPWWDGQIFRVDAYKDLGALWTGITPTVFDEAPRYPDRVALNALNPYHFTAIFGRETMENLVYTGINVVDSAEWISVGTLPKQIIGMSVLGDFVIVWGGQYIKMSETGLEGVYNDKTGSWTSTVGAIGSILGVVCII